MPLYSDHCWVSENALKALATDLLHARQQARVICTYKMRKLRHIITKKYPLQKPPSSHNQPRQKPSQPLRTLLRILPQRLFHLANQLLRLPSQPLNHPLTILKTPLLLQISHRIPLDLLIRRLLLKNIIHHAIRRIRPNSMYNRETKLPLRQILAHPFQTRVLARTRQIQVVVQDLKQEAYRADERRTVDGYRALGLHQLDGEAEQPPRFVVDHLEVFGFGGAGEAVAPVEFHALAAVQVEEFVGVDVDEGGVGEREELLEGAEVDVVCGVDRLRDPEDGVCDRDAAAEEGGVFDVVDAGGGVLAWEIDGRGAEKMYRRDAVCSMPTTRVMTSSRSGGTFSHLLKAAMHWLRMSFPGCPTR